jgi:hypothetical protein
MKVTRSKVLIVLLVLGLIMVYANLFISYVNQQKAQSALRDQIETSIKTLSLLPPPTGDAQKRLNAAQQTYDDSVSAVSGTDVDSIQVIETIIKTAVACNLKVNPTTTEQWTEKTYGLSTYRSLPLIVEIKGSHLAIIDYVKLLEDRSQFPFLAIEGLTISVVTSGEGTAGSDEQRATLNANIIIRLAPQL